jgi:hypothetical protein
VKPVIIVGICNLSHGPQKFVDTPAWISSSSAWSSQAAGRRRDPRQKQKALILRSARRASAV